MGGGEVVHCQGHSGNFADADLQVVVDCGSADGISLMLREWKRSGPLAFPPEVEISISPISDPNQSGITGK
jgi:hypothetical protein